MGRIAAVAVVVVAVTLTGTSGIRAPAPDRGEPTAARSRPLAVIGPDQRATREAATRGAPAERHLRRHRGLAWRLPAGWHAVTDRLNALADPSQALVAASFPLRQRRPDPGCTLATARRRLPARGALVLLLESRWAAGAPRRLRAFPPRPAHLRLPGHAVALECFGAARAVGFREAERGFQAFVLLGPRAGARRVRQAERLLDSLRVAPVPPPARPVWDMWRELITEAGDTLHVPPGWTTGTLAVPRRLHRPRLLFYAATSEVAGWARGHRARLGSPRPPATGGVVLWVAERRRGGVSPRFRSLRDEPFADSAAFRPVPGRPGTRAWRAGGAWRGYRFAVTVTAAEGAPPEDVERAFSSASSLAPSGGLRDCSHAAERRRPDLCAGAR